MGIGLAMVYFWGLADNANYQPIAPPSQETQYILDPRPKPIGDLFLSGWNPAPSNPLYGIQNLIDPSLIPENQPIYNEAGQLQAGSMNILNWSTGPSYEPTYGFYGGL